MACHKRIPRLRLHLGEEEEMLQSALTHQDQVRESPDPCATRSRTMAAEKQKPPPDNGSAARSKGANDGEEEEVEFEVALEKVGYGTYNHLLLMTGIVSSLSHQGNTAMMSYLLPAAECDLELTPVRKGILTAIPYAGMLCSSMLWGFLSDTMGRRRLLVIAYLLDALCSVLSSFAQAFWFMLLLRFFGGCIISGPMGIHKTFLSEFHGPAKRPVMMMWMGVFVSIANVYFPLLAWVLLPQTFEWRPAPGFVFNSWRLFVLCNSVPAFLASLSIFFFSESPKFLLSSGRHDEALRVLRSMYQRNKGVDASAYPVRRLKAETQQTVLTGACSGGGGSTKRSPVAVLRLGWRQVKPLFLRPHSPRAALVFVLNFLTLIGMNTIRLWVPQLFSSIEEYHHAREQLHLTDVEGGVTLCQMLAEARPNSSSEVLQSVPDSVCSVGLMENTVYIRAGIIGASTGVACLLAGFTIRVTGKRAMMMACFMCGGAAGVAMYWGASDNDVLAMSAAYVALVGVAHTVTLSVVVELFPTQLRNLAMNATLMAGQLGTVIGNLAFPILLQLDCVMLFFIIGGLAIVCSAMCMLIPKTKDLETFK